MPCSRVPVPSCELSRALRSLRRHAQAFRFTPSANTRPLALGQRPDGARNRRTSRSGRRTAGGEELRVHGTREQPAQSRARRRFDDDRSVRRGRSTRSAFATIAGRSSAGAAPSTSRSTTTSNEAGSRAARSAAPWRFPPARPRARPSAAVCGDPRLPASTAQARPVNPDLTASPAISAGIAAADDEHAVAKLDRLPSRR